MALKKGDVVKVGLHKRNFDDNGNGRIRKTLNGFSFTPANIFMSVQLALILIGFGIGYAEFRSTMEYLRKTIDDIDRKTDTFVTKENLSYIMQNIDTKISALDQNVKTMQDQVADLYRQHRLQERE